MMFMGDHHDALRVVHERGRTLHAEAAAERMRRTSRTRRALAATLRRTADHLDPAPFAWPIKLGAQQLGEQR
jgi:hypothetical protein